MHAFPDATQALPHAVQGAGAAFSPALGGWIAQWAGFSPTFLVLGALGLLAAGTWVALGAIVKQY